MHYSYKKCQKIGETGSNKDQRFACLDNPRHNIWNKME